MKMFFFFLTKYCIFPTEEFEEQVNESEYKVCFEYDAESYTSQASNIIAELNVVDCQPKTTKRKKLMADKSPPQTPLKNRKKSIETKPKSRKKRKPTRGTDVWCHLCDTTFDLPRVYMRHMRDKHTPEILKFSCAECPKSFGTKQKMRHHANTHRPTEQKKIHPCPQCGKKFSKPENVALHIRIVHNGDRPYVCEECGKTCATKGALKEHQVIHSDARPFKCKDCPKSFKDLPGLKKHTESHTITAFECVQCGQRLNTRQTLKVHMLVHSDEKRYKCHHCGNAYKRYPTLKVTIRLFPCIDFKNLNQTSFLQDHLILHTGMRPYACPFCDVTYANGSNLRTHKKKCHPIELAAMEAAGQVTPSPVIPNAKYLQPNHAPT